MTFKYFTCSNFHTMCEFLAWIYFAIVFSESYKNHIAISSTYLLLLWSFKTICNGYIYSDAYFLCKSCSKICSIFTHFEEMLLKVSEHIFLKENCCLMKFELFDVSAILTINIIFFAKYNRYGLNAETSIFSDLCWIFETNGKYLNT